MTAVTPQRRAGWVSSFLWVKRYTESRGCLKWQCLWDCSLFILLHTPGAQEGGEAFSLTNNSCVNARLSKPDSSPLFFSYLLALVESLAAVLLEILVSFFLGCACSRSCSAGTDSRCSISELPPLVLGLSSGLCTSLDIVGPKAINEHANINRLQVSTMSDSWVDLGTAKCT